MNGPRDSGVYLEDILDSARKAQEFVGELTLEQFEADEKTVFAVIRALEIIGEATKQVPPEVRAQAPSIPWRLMAGMRDKLIHSYSGVDLQVVWRTVHEELPGLVLGVQDLMSSLKVD